MRSVHEQADEFLLRGRMREEVVRAADGDVTDDAPAFQHNGAAGEHGFHKVRTAIRLKIDGERMYDLEVGEWPRK